jgi:predicted RND superfamily exporter protein
MHKQGTPNERMVEAMIDIGVAVINGAVSTLCAVVVLAFSNSYVFQAFFKQLLLCIIFGLGHGMILLPVLLSLVGPKAFKVHTYMMMMMIMMMTSPTKAQLWL